MDGANPDSGRILPPNSQPAAQTEPAHNAPITTPAPSPLQHNNTPTQPTHPDNPEPHAATRSLFAFSCAGARLALASSAVCEITNATFVHRLPHPDRVGGAIDGISNIGGELVPVIDIVRALKLPRREACAADIRAGATRRQCMVLCKSGGEKFAFKTDSITGVLRIGETLISVEPAPNTPFLPEKIASGNAAGTLVVDAELLSAAIARRLI